MCQTCISLADGLIIVAQESAGAIKVCLAVDSEEALLSFRDQARRAGTLLMHVLHCRQAALYSYMSMDKSSLALTTSLA